MTAGKKILLMLAMLVLALAAEAKYSCFVAPAQILEGDYFDIVITSDSDAPPILVSEIPNIHIVSRSSFTNIINGVVSHELRLRCSTNQTGTVEIPPFSVQINGKIEQTGKLTLHIQSADDALKTSTEAAAAATLPPGTGDQKDAFRPDPSQAVSAIGTLANPRTEYYVGEQIWLNLRLFYQSKYVEISDIEYPDLNLGKAIISNFSMVNRENPNFAPPRQLTMPVDGVEYNVILFTTAFQPAAPGTIQLAATERVRFLLMRDRRRLVKTLVYTMPEITLKPVPAPPGGIFSLNLVGDWKVEATQSKSTVPAGEAMELIVKIQGQGPLDNLVAPELKFADCRVFPPEVDKQSIQNQAQLRYIIVPLKAGKLEQEIKLGTFDPIKSDYVPQFVKLNLDVTPGNPGAVPEVTPQNADDDIIKPYKPSASELKNLVKMRPMGSVSLPLYMNKLYLIILLLAVGPAVWLISEFRRYYRKKQIANPELVRKQSALSRRSKVLRRLRSADNEELLNVINSDVLPFLNDFMGYPPGSGCADVADLTTSKPLAELMHEMAANDYLPQEHRKLDNPADFKRRLLKIIKKLTVILLIFSAVQAFGATWEETCDAMYAQDKVYAESLLNELHVLNRPDPAVLYNMGSNYWQKGDYALALWAFERAHLLAPRDGEIVDSLNVLRRRFFMAQAGNSNTTKELLSSARDWFRPDDYMLFAAILVFAAFMLLTFKRRIGKWQFRAIFGSLWLLTALLITLISWQFATTYNPERAIVISNNARLRAMPSDSESVSSQPVTPGTNVLVVDSRGEYCQVKINGNTGYMKCSDLRKILAEN